MIDQAKIQQLYKSFDMMTTVSITIAGVSFSLILFIILMIYWIRNENSRIFPILVSFTVTLFIVLVTSLLMVGHILNLKKNQITACITNQCVLPEVKAAQEAAEKGKTGSEAETTAKEKSDSNKDKKSAETVQPVVSTQTPEPVNTTQNNNADVQK